MKLFAVLLLAASTVAAQPPPRPPVRPDVPEDPWAAHVEKTKELIGIIKGAAVREEDGDHPRQAAVKAAPQYTPAGTTKLIDGYFYTADGAGTWKFCESCNGCTFEQALAKYHAAARVVPPTAPFTQGPSSGQGLPSRPGAGLGFPSIPAIGVNNAARLSTQSLGIYRVANTFTGASMGMSGGIRGCATGGG